MKRLPGWLLLVGLVLLATPVLAHVPSFPGDNTTPERAVEVPDAVKSWSFYDELESGDVTYYRFSLEAGDRLRAGTFTPASGEFAPSMVVMSSEFDRPPSLPAGVSVPAKMGAIVVPGERPVAATLEPFGPSANYHTSTLNRAVDVNTTVLVAVYEPANRSGPAGFTVGYAEEFSVVEYLTVPFDLVAVHTWEGQSPMLAIGPFVLLLLIGLGAIWWERDRYMPLQAGLALGGLTLVASGVNTAVQLGIALGRTGPTASALVTLAFVLVPILAGWWVLRVARRDRPVLAPLTRAGLVLAAIAALATWAGFLIGPAIILGLAMLPSRFQRTGGS